jgi:hypothetical protein
VKRGSVLAIVAASQKNYSELDIRSVTASEP